MALKLRATGLGSGIDKDRPDYTVFTGEWLIGRIYERHGFPDNVRCSGLLHGVVLTQPPSVHTDGTAAESGGGEGAVSEELGCLEGMGEAGGGTVTRLEPARPRRPSHSWRRRYGSCC